MFSDGILPLVECNAITNAKKQHHTGRIVTSFAYGSEKLYKFIDNNPGIHFGDVQWVNDPSIIRQNPKVCAINSAVEVDLTGQVGSEHVWASKSMFMCRWWPTRWARASFPASAARWTSSAARR